MSLSQQIGIIGGDHGALSAKKEGWDIMPEINASGSQTVIMPEITSEGWGGINDKEGWDINPTSKETMISLKANPTGGNIKPRFI